MGKLFQLSEASFLALHAIVILALEPDKKINLKTLAKKLNASLPHLSKVMQILAKKGYILSTRGPSGGFILNKNPEDIYLIHIYEAIEGTLNVSKCPFGKEKCVFKKCIIGFKLTECENNFIEYLEKESLANYINSMRGLYD